MTPEQEAMFALHWNISRSELPAGAQLEYDRLRTAWRLDEAWLSAGESKAARLGWEREHPPADQWHGSQQAAGPGSDTAPVNGDQVRDIWFCPPEWSEVAGYRAQDVDDLLRRVAAELDAGRAAGPLIENATLRRRKWGRRYDIEAVDWFLGQALPRPGYRELSGISDDPWHDLPVAQLAPGVVSGTAELYAPGKPPREADWAYFARQCEKAWRDFGQLPGTRLRWGSAGRGLSELRTAEQQALVSRRTERGDETFSAGGRSFTRKRTSARSSSPPGAAEFAARVVRADLGHFANNTHTWDIWSQSHKLSATDRRVRELVDDTGTPIVYTCGINFGWRARAYIMFPDQRWLRFLVRGTRVANAIMTAVDQAGNRVARYRVPLSDSVQIIVHPDWELTDELALALAVSTRWLSSYFVRPEGGGG